MQSKCGRCGDKLQDCGDDEKQFMKQCGKCGRIYVQRKRQPEKKACDVCNAPLGQHSLQMVPKQNGKGVGSEANVEVCGLQCFMDYAQALQFAGFPQE